MSLITNWGYTLTEMDELPAMLTPSEYFLFTAGKYNGDPRIESNIAAASSAIRNYIGWHLYPSAACKLDMALNDRRISFNGRDMLIQLPAKYVTSIETVQIDGSDITAYTYEVNGILRLYDVNLTGLKRYTPISITYTAGITDALMGDIRELIAHRVTHALASSNGITTEQVGGVSVTYNAGWVNSAQASSLQDSNKETLGPYRLQGVF